MSLTAKALEGQSLAIKEMEAHIGDPGVLQAASTAQPVEFRTTRTAAPDGPSVELPRIARLIREINGHDRDRVRKFCDLLAAKAQEHLQ